MHRITTVRMSVAKSALMLATPTLAKIAVRAAKAAERRAHGSQPEENVGNMTLLPRERSDDGEAAHNTPLVQLSL